MYFFPWNSVPSNSAHCSARKSLEPSGQLWRRKHLHRAIMKRRTTKCTIKTCPSRLPYKISSINSCLGPIHFWWGTADEHHSSVMPERQNLTITSEHERFVWGKGATGKQKQNKQKNTDYKQVLYLNIAWAIASSWSNATGSTFCPERQKKTMKLSEEYAGKKSSHGRQYKSSSHRAYCTHTVSWSSIII